MVFGLQHDPIVALGAGHHPQAKSEPLVQKGQDGTAGSLKIVGRNRWHGGCIVGGFADPYQPWGALSEGASGHEARISDSRAYLIL